MSSSFSQGVLVGAVAAGAVFLASELFGRTSAGKQTPPRPRSDQKARSHGKATFVELAATQFYGPNRSEEALESALAVMGYETALAVALHDVDMLLDRIRSSNPSSIVGTPTSVPVPFGAPLRILFKLKNPERYLNHGSYGGAFVSCIAVENHVRGQLQTNPNLMIEAPMQAVMARAVGALASHLNVPLDNVFLVPNTTYGVGSVVRSFPFRYGEKLLTLSSNYLACKHSMDRACNESGAKLVVINDAPDEHAEFLAFLETHLARERPTLVVLDHISSMSGMILPIPAAVKLCHKYGAVICVDGAHCIGQIPLDLDAIGADFYVSNCHKWLLASICAAFLYIRDPAKFNMIHPLVDSHGYGSGIRAEFTWMGTYDYSSYGTIPAAFATFERLGGLQRSMDYCHRLATNAANMLAKAWGTELLTTNEALYGNMCCILIPGLKNAKDGITVGEGPKYDIDGVSVGILRDMLLYDKELPLTISMTVVRGRLYIRISGQIYLELDDFVPLRDRLPAAVRKYFDNNRKTAL